MDEKLVMLIVDDVEINRSILKTIFENEYETVEAENGLTALTIMKERKDIAIILLDVVMPVMNGLEFLEKIKAEPEFAKIPVIVNTQVGEEENEIKALDLGADDFIIKPYNPKLVVRRVRNITQKSILERQKIERNLKDTKERLDSLIDTVPGGIGIFEISEKITCIYFNDGLCELLGLTREEVLRRKDQDSMRLVYDEDRKMLQNGIDCCIKTGETLQCSFRVMQRNRQYIWMSVSAIRFRESNGHPIFHAVFTDISEEKRRQELMEEAMEELVFRAERDMLTELYNRDKFYNTTRDMLKTNKNDVYVIVQWNIDRFKVVNDLFGSRAGDRILNRMAQLLREKVGNKGTYGRLEADHFVCCVKKEFFEENYDSILLFLQTGIWDEMVGYPILVHIGVYEITDITIPVDLMCDRANLALLTVKGNYIKRCAFYNDILRDTMINEQELIGEMETALSNNQFYINLQPIFNANTKTPASAEALVRWKHPVKGIISPGLFIPIFEKNGFITKLDMFVWEEVCKVLAEAKKEGLPIVPVSVNVSRMNFYSPDLCDKIDTLTKKYGIDPHMIKFEITESAYTDNPHQLLETMGTLQKKGYRILMDDFGSGYSSLNMLKDVPVDVLKIDMKFIDDLETSERAASILINVIRMAKSLNMEVIAEGVETSNQYIFLKKMGCDCIQGYYFSRPLPVEDYKALMCAKDTFYFEEKAEKDKKTILLVEDSEISRTAVSATLKNEYKILEAQNGKTALEVLKKNSRTVDMIITDIIMPEMDGFELLEYLRSDIVYRHIPIVVITAMSKMDDEMKALEMGAVDVIMKPFDPAVILQRIRNLLRLSEVENIQSEFHMMKKNQEVKQNIQEIIDNSQAGISRLRIKRSEGLSTARIVYANRTFYSLRGLQKVEMENVEAMDYIGANLLEHDFEMLLEKLNTALEKKEERVESLYRIKDEDSRIFYVRFECRIQYFQEDCIMDVTEVEFLNTLDDETAAFQ